MKIATEGTIVIITIILVSWRTPDDRRLVERVIGAPGVDYRVCKEGELAAERRGDLDALAGCLRRSGVDLGDLEPLPEGYDPFAE
jgi:hypothetical protein